MSRRFHSLERRCIEAMRRHLESGGEETLHEAYEFGRMALAEGVGVLDMALLMWRAIPSAFAGRDDMERAKRAEGFLLECLSPFEMAHRGAREANESLRRLEERREQDVQRIARELHDQAGQLLATVFLSLDTLRPHLAPEGEDRLGQIVALLQEAEEEVRRVAHELRPSILDDLGLMPALSMLAEGVAQRAGLQIRVAGSTPGRLPPRIETELYRSAQEALSNIARHSCASRALIEVWSTRSGVNCAIRDDGRGFDPARPVEPGKSRGLGLDSIRERLAPLGGALEIHSRPGAGTELQIHVPLEVSHAHAYSHSG